MGLRKSRMRLLYFFIFFLLWPIYRILVKGLTVWLRKLLTVCFVVDIRELERYVFFSIAIRYVR